MVEFPRRTRRQIEMALIRDAAGVSTLDIRDDTGAEVDVSLFGSGTGVNVRNFGALGDGVSDDTEAIAAATAEVVAAGGGAILFPAGTYLTGPQTIHSKVVWVGQSRQQSVIKLKAGSNADLLSTKDFAILTGTNGVGGNIGCRGHGLRHLTLDANRAQQTAQSRCYASYGWNHTVFDVDFINGHTTGVTSVWTATDSTADHMEALWSNFKIWNYGGVKGGATGLDWSGPHDSILSTFVVATLDSTIRPYHATYGATPINSGGGPTASFPGSGTFTFTTTEAAPTDLFPESGGYFVVPFDNGNGNFIAITYTSAATVGSVTTFSGCTGAGGRVVGTSAPNVGIIKPTHGILINGTMKAESGLVMSQGHVWGRNHIGLACKMLSTPYNDIPFFATGCHIEGAFLVNVMMSTKSTFTGGAIYGTNGQVGNEYEVGVLMSLPNRGANDFRLETLIYNINKSAGPASCAPIVNSNSDRYDISVHGSTSTTNMINTAGVYKAQSRARIMCSNDATKSVEWYPYSTMIPSFGGGFVLGNPTNGNTGVRITSGPGIPSNTIPGAIGDLFIRTDGTVGSLIYRGTAVTSGLITTWAVVL